MTATAARPGVPRPILLGLLGQHRGDPTARLTDLAVEPIEGGGYSGHRLFRVNLSWRARDAGGPTAARWIVKQWRPGGHSARLIGRDDPVEALAWTSGLLRPANLPPGVRTPLIGALPDPDDGSWWIAQEDVSPALRRYSREAPLPPELAASRLRTILARLAAFHVRWQGPAGRSALRRHRWLVSAERVAWCEAGSYADVLGRPRPARAAPGTPVSEEFRANVLAFLSWHERSDRTALAEVLCDRTALTSGLAALPPTLRHGDLDDRNIGLVAGAGADGVGDTDDEQGALLLIDWEWTGPGPALLDVVRVWASFAAVCDRAQPLPPGAQSGALPRHYLDTYRRLGGAPVDDRDWERQFDLALLANACSQVDFFGAMVRRNVRPVLATLEPQFALMARAARSLAGARGPHP